MVQVTIIKRMNMESERNLMTTTEAARYLGLKPSYLYKMMMRRAIPYYKPATSREENFASSPRKTLTLG